jgi:Tfp pilus assembly protein PilV
MRISAHGKGEEGYILLDVMVALFVAMIGFGALFGAIKTSIDFTVKSEKQKKESIIERNEKANSFDAVLSYEK